MIAASGAAEAVNYATLPRVNVEFVHKSAAWAVHRAKGNDKNEVDRDEEAVQCELVRDILGNPYRPVTLKPAWLTRKMKTLAQAIYDDRTFERMPELAHALAEAGSSNEDILSHCRGPGPHVRGCCVVDLLLGKALAFFVSLLIWSWSFFLTDYPPDLCGSSTAGSKMLRGPRSAAFHFGGLRLLLLMTVDSMNSWNEDATSSAAFFRPSL